MLPGILRRNPQDLVFTWNDLIKELVYQLSSKSVPSLTTLFVLRPQQFLNSVSTVFFTKECSINDKIVFMECLCEGI